MSASASEVREIVELLREIKSLLNEVDTKSEMTTSRLTEVRGSLAAAFSLMNVMGLPPPIDGAITKMRYATTTAWGLKSALDALSASTPYTAIMGAVGWVTTVSSGFSYLMDNLKGYKR